MCALLAELARRVDTRLRTRTTSVQVTGIYSCQCAQSNCSHRCYLGQSSEYFRRIPRTATSRCSFVSHKSEPVSFTVEKARRDILQIKSSRRAAAILGTTRNRIGCVVAPARRPILSSMPTAFAELDSDSTRFDHESARMVR